MKLRPGGWGEAVSDGTHLEVNAEEAAVNHTRFEVGARGPPVSDPLNSPAARTMALDGFPAAHRLLPRPATPAGWPTRADVQEPDPFTFLSTGESRRGQPTRSRRRSWRRQQVVIQLPHQWGHICANQC